jgi:hypothetical protein
MMRRTALLSVALVAASVWSLPAAAAPRDRVDDALAAAQRWTDRFLDQAERFVVIGGILVAQNRNAVSGGLLGCAAGAAAGATTAVTLGAATGGAAIAGTPQAMALGCGLGAAAGAALGHPLDHPGGP